MRLPTLEKPSPIDPLETTGSFGDHTRAAINIKFREIERRLTALENPNPMNEPTGWEDNSNQELVRMALSKILSLSHKQNIQTELLRRLDRVTEL